MKTVAVHDRPREKLERVGVSAVGDNELLAIVLGHGAARASVLELANLVLDAAGGLHGLARATPDDLRRIPGIGRARAAQLLAAIEAGRRTLVRGRCLPGQQPVHDAGNRPGRKQRHLHLLQFRSQ